MQFRRIELENWRGLYDSSLSLELEESLNVIVGPNESGKSTALEALRLALTTKASSRKGEVKDLQPWDTDLKPRVELEFRANGSDYRLEKTYLKSSGNASFSERLEGGEWTKIAEDDDAHSRFLRTLELTESEGFFRTLWAPQGENLTLKVSEGLQSRIEEAVGSATSELGGKILDYVRSKVGGPETRGWLTKKRRNPGSGSPWRETLDRLEKLRGELKDLEEKREKHFERLEKIADLRDEKNELEGKRRKKEEELKKQRRMKEEWDGFRKLKKKAEEAKNWHDRLREAKRDWDDKINELSEGEEEIASLRKEIDDLKERKKEKVSEKEDRKADLGSARDKLDELRAELGCLRGLRAARLNERIEKVEEKLDGLDAPEESNFGKIKSSREKLVSKREQLEASRLDIEFSAERDLEGKISLDGQEKEIDLSAGEKLDRGALKSFRLKLEGTGELSVSTGMEGALEVRDEVEELEEELEAELSGYGAKNWEELEKLFQEGEKGREKLQKLRLRRRELDLKEIDSFDRSDLRDYVSDHPGISEDFLGSVREKETKELEALIERKKENLEKREREEEELEERLRKAKSEVEKVTGEITGLEGKLETETTLRNERLSQLEKLKDQIRKLDERFRGRETSTGSRNGSFDPDEEKESRLYRELKEAWGDARDERDELEHEVERKRPKGEEVTEETIERLKDRIESLREKVRELNEKINRLQGRIGQTADGLHGEIRAKEEEIEKQKRRLESAEKEARSHELLRLALEEAKEKMSRKYLEPIRKKVASRMKEMTGERYECVDFDKNLAPESLLRDRREARARKEELSFGTREQLMFLTRLAMAEVISGEKRVPVIFDDSLVNTDDSRLEYARSYLKKASENCQIIVFTCHGEDYSFENPGKRIELDPLP